MHRNLGTTDDIRTRDAILTVCSWVYGEKMAFLYHLKRQALGCQLIPAEEESGGRRGRV